MRWAMRSLQRQWSSGRVPAAASGSRLVSPPSVGGASRPTASSRSPFMRMRSTRPSAAWATSITRRTSESPSNSGARLASAFGARRKKASLNTTSGSSG